MNADILATKKFSEVSPKIIVSEEDAYVFCVWVQEIWRGASIQGFPLVRVNGKVRRVKYGTYDNTLDVAWVWENRRILNDFIRRYNEETSGI